MAATSTELAIIARGKEFVNARDTFGLQKFYEELQESEFDVVPSWAYIFQKIYLHACLKGLRDAAVWLEGVAQNNPEITQLGFRQTIAYGRQLLSRVSSPSQ